LRKGKRGYSSSRQEGKMNVDGICETSQYLTFTLGEEKYAVDVCHIREILDCTTITKVPRAPDFMLGVINLRGSVVPVVDMRLKFGMSATVNSITTCIIVVEILFDNETIMIGALADSVQEVLELEPELIEASPKIGVGVQGEFIRGMGKNNGQFIMILDIDKVFSMDETCLVSTVSVS
jgi:purine-binding chemotaxis protein CheW